MSRSSVKDIQVVFAKLMIFFHYAFVACLNLVLICNINVFFMQVIVLDRSPHKFVFLFLNGLNMLIISMLYDFV